MSDGGSRIYRLKAQHRPIFHLLANGNGFDLSAEVPGDSEWIALLTWLREQGFLESADPSKAN